MSGFFSGDSSSTSDLNSFLCCVNIWRTGGKPVTALTSCLVYDHFKQANAMQYEKNTHNEIKLSFKLITAFCIAT